MSANGSPLPNFDEAVNIGLGIASSLAEAITDPAKREETLATFNLSPEQQKQIFSEKGRVVGVQAQEFARQVYTQVNQPRSASQPGGDVMDGEVVPPSPKKAELNAALQDLIAELSTIRQQIEAELTP